MNSTSSKVRRATLVASLTEAPSASGNEVHALSSQADVLEVRADLVGDIDVAWLRERFDGELLYTLRSVAEGGSGPVDAARRAERLAAARHHDLVDLEADRDLGPGLLRAVEPARRIVSWHGRAADLTVLGERLRQMRFAPARLYKLVTAAERSGEELAPLELLLDLFSGADRQDDDGPHVVAFAMGAVGAWTRLVAPRLGAPWVFGAAGQLAAAPGQPSIERLRLDYDLPHLQPASRLFGVVGHPAAHSLSPRLHNAGYRSLGEAALYVAFDAPCFETFWQRVAGSDLFERAGLPLMGLSVTAPHKASALRVAARASEAASAARGANTLLAERNGSGNRVWRAESTDPQGVTGPLLRRGVELSGRRAVVIGAGGAGRAAAAGLAAAGAEVTLANRTASTGRQAAEAVDATFVPLDRLCPGDFEVVVNATSLGYRSDDPLPCDPRALDPAAAAVELVYGGGETPWSLGLGERGLRVVNGREVLLHQGLVQFEAMTGQPMPFATGAAALGLEASP